MLTFKQGPDKPACYISVKTLRHVASSVPMNHFLFPWHGA